MSSIYKYRLPAKVTTGFSEVGYSGLNQFAGTLREEFLTELRGKAGMRVYREMRDNDPLIGAILFSVGMLIRQASWTVIPYSEDESDEEVAEFIDGCRDDMSMTWSDVLSEIMTMLTFGWSWLELVYKKRNGYNRDDTLSSRFTDGRIGWRKLPLRAQETLDKWEFDDTGGTIAMHQLTPDGKTARIPLEKSLLFRTESTKNNPEGRSILRNSYRPWYFKKRIEEIEGIGIERDLAGLPVLQPPEGLDIWNPSDQVAVRYRTEAETLIRNIRRDEQEGVLLPFGWELTLLTTGGRRNFDTSAIIERYNNTMAMTTMADFIVLGHNNRYGSFALAGSKTHMFGMAIGGWLDMIADVFNRYAIPRLLAINGLDISKPPKLQHGDVEVPDLNELSNYIERMARAGFKLFPNPVLEKHLLRVGSMPIEGVELGRENEVNVDPETGQPIEGPEGEVEPKSTVTPPQKAEDDSEEDD